MFEKSIWLGETSDLFDFKIKINSAAYLYDNDFDIELAAKNSIISSNIAILELRSQYAMHRCCNRIAYQKRIYTKERLTELMKNFPVLLYDENL